jgi:ADP-ribosylglycohydrolase
VDIWNDPDSTEKNLMIGAIAGDIIGSVYERRRIKTKDFPLFDVRT